MFGTHAQVMVSDEVPIHARPRLNCSTKNVDNGLTNNLMSTHVVSTQQSNNDLFINSLFVQYQRFYYWKNDKSGQKKFSHNYIGPMNNVNCGFSSNWILPYFPLFVCPSVRSSQA